MVQLQLGQPATMGQFLSTVVRFLSSISSTNAEVIEEFANPESATYHQLFDGFISLPSLQQQGQNIDNSERAVLFYHEIIIPLKAMMDLGGKLALEKKGAFFSQQSSSSSNINQPRIPLIIPLNDKSSKTSVAPPAAPRPVFDKTNNSVSSSNTLFLSRLPGEIHTNKGLVLDSLHDLEFPSELIDAPGLRHRVGKHDTTCFLQGPDDDPMWATKMMEAKPRSALYDSDVHMAFAKPRPPRSPGRDSRRAEIRARLDRHSRSARSSDNTTPRARSPKSDDGQSKKRPMEGRMKLHYYYPMEVADTPAAKQPNHQNTPFFRRQDNRSEDNSGDEKNDMVMATPQPNKLSVQGDKSYKEVVVTGVGLDSEQNEMSFDDAMPSPHATKNKEEGERKEEGEASN